MPTHKTEDYKLSAVKYYLKNDFSMKYVCDIFECKKQSLLRWVDRYLSENSIKRHNRLSVSYKIGLLIGVLKWHQKNSAT